ncbi:MAG: hypothetical protein A3H17_00305 [Candidatus Levybacteria bacterium RIFCSPLOWO2_12_FULL_37_14]|nr:MAG: hypothetical protein US43_C0014G0016 [Candidatus Levybacteria bacterium GW2011_GWA1_37_16]KKQ37805.1 MAG: hypothetical protein US55_C0022G0009 [Candidatus Levybacteria bacterium GW2011_GWC2_37_7]KKQ42541.1 MAG: hypothetical protein US59_C0007G0004 [Candidatus Levybacteria bacterium GW2011_GWB1_37_8]OGH51561.1 MAG: hypothetical protein A3H17_00305 [Candidatus Levybacteria bacterium RIFCSPLOWO2_12_FULL_37_14]
MNCKFFLSYLKKINVKDPKKLTFRQKRLIFIYSIADFKRLKISIYRLAEIASYLWRSLTGMEKAKTELGSILLDCLEFTSYSSPKTKDDKENFEYYMKKIMKYYDRNKELIDSNYF